MIGFLGRWVVVSLLLLITGCQTADYRTRFQAEKARYWAERGDLKFALESNPQIRDGLHASAARHVGVAEKSRPTGIEAIDAELAEIRGQSLLRAGVALLQAGEYDAAERQLATAQAESPPLYAREAAYLRARWRIDQEQYEDAIARYQELFALFLDNPEASAPSETLLSLPANIAFVVKEHVPTRLQDWVTWGREVYERIWEQWPQENAAQRARFLIHRLAVANGEWAVAIADLEAFEAGAESINDLYRARINRAEVMAFTDQIEEALTLYRDCTAKAPLRELRGLARLRACDAIARLDGVDVAIDSLVVLSRDFADMTAIAAAAEARQARLMVQRGDWNQAIRQYRRIQTRYPNSDEGVDAPLSLVELYAARGDSVRARTAMQQAVTIYRHVLAAQPGDVPVAVDARNYLADLLVRVGEPHRALIELEQIHHFRGGSLDGTEALLKAARVAQENLGDKELSRRYLGRVLQEVPGSRLARLAQEQLDGLD